MKIANYEKNAAGRFGAGSAHTICAYASRLERLVIQ